VSGVTVGALYDVRCAAHQQRLRICFPFDALNPGGPLQYVVVAEAA
jgi:hypothetical protein